jgi:hypothetical protein
MNDQGLVRIYRMPGGTNAQYDEVVGAAGDVIAAGAAVHLAGSDRIFGSSRCGPTPKPSRPGKRHRQQAMLLSRQSSRILR